MTDQPTERPLHDRLVEALSFTLQMCINLNKGVDAWPHLTQLLHEAGGELPSERRTKRAD